jgi:hypothetical protein
MEAVLTEDAFDADLPGDPPVAPLYMEHRFGQRFRCGTTVRLSAGDGITGQGRLANVSLSGAYLETSLPLPLFATVEVASETGGRAGVELLGSVVRKDARGVGIEWCETPACSICEIFGCGKRCEAV